MKSYEAPSYKYEAPKMEQLDRVQVMNPIRNEVLNKKVVKPQPV